MKAEYPQLADKDLEVVGKATKQSGVKVGVEAPFVLSGDRLLTSWAIHTLPEHLMREHSTDNAEIEAIFRSLIVKVVNYKKGNYHVKDVNCGGQWLYECLVERAGRDFIENESAVVQKNQAANG